MNSPTSENDVKFELPTETPALKRESTYEGYDWLTRNELITSEEKERFLLFNCQHKGKYNGKPWKDVQTTDYPYFMWAVKNTMGRHTKTFRVFVECLKPCDIELVKQSNRKPMKLATLVPAEDHPFTPQSTPTPE